MPHGVLHGAKMDWDVWGVGDEAAIGSKESTTEVQSLFDVG